jgi:hypothetical protein
MILDRLQAAGVTVQVRGDRLLLTPADRVTPELVSQARAFKARLIAHLTWSKEEAEAALGACLDRIGRACVHVPDDVWGDVQLADAEEAINVAFAREDHRALDVALTELERLCLGQYGAPAPTPGPGKAEPGGDGTNWTSLRRPRAGTGDASPIEEVRRDDAPDNNPLSPRRAGGAP